MKVPNGETSNLSIIDDLVVLRLLFDDGCYSERDLNEAGDVIGVIELISRSNGSLQGFSRRTTLFVNTFQIKICGGRLL